MKEIVRVNEQYDGRYAYEDAYDGSDKSVAGQARNKAYIAMVKANPKKYPLQAMLFDVCPSEVVVSTTD